MQSTHHAKTRDRPGRWPTWSLTIAVLGCASGANTLVPQATHGDWIAFGECESERRPSQIVVAHPDGTGRHAVTANVGSSWFPSWSPDGNRIAYVYEAASGMQIWVADADGSNNHALTVTGHSIAPTWSRDGRLIAFAHTASPAGAFKIWVMDADGANAGQVTHTTAATTDENVPRWSPDGLQMTYTSNSRGHYEIWVIDVATGANPHVLTESYYDSTLRANIEQKVPAWSPDGTRIVYWSGVEASDTRPNLPRDVWIMNADGTGNRRLISGDDPNWSPDGLTVIFSTGGDNLPAIGAVAPDGRDARVLFTVQACRPLQSSWVNWP